jgi:regulatory protein
MKPDLRARALSCLARREYSRQELRRKLAPHAEDAGALDTLLDELQTRGWLSEARFVEQILHARQGKYGMQRIAHELREKGIAEALIEEALPQIKETELETARAVWAKKFGALPQDAKERARQMRFLQSRGFSPDVIGKVLRWGEA